MMVGRVLLVQPMGTKAEVDMAQEKVKSTIYLPDDTHYRLKLRAAEERNSMTQLVLQAIEEMLARPGRRSPVIPEEDMSEASGQDG